MKRSGRVVGYLFRYSADHIDRRCRTIDDFGLAVVVKSGCFASQMTKNPDRASGLQASSHQPDMSRWGRTLHFNKVG